MSAVRTLVAWCPDWPIAAAGVDGDTQPAAVFHANRVVACSAAARRSGVRREQRRREAQGRCPEIVVLAHDPDGEARAFEPVVAALDDICPRVEVIRPGLCAFATRGPSRYFGGDAAVAERVTDAISRAAGSECRTGIADGPFAATIAARTGRGVIVPPGKSASFLASFPVSVLDTVLANDGFSDLLRRLGIRTLGALAALPAEQVLGRFGADGAHAHRLAAGLDERALAPRTPPPDLSASMLLDPPVEQLDAAAFVAKSLAGQLHDELRRRGLACTRIAIEAETEHGERLERLWRHDGSLSASAIAERVRWQLDGWLNGSAGAAQPTAGITLLRLVPDQVHPDHGRQQGFWGGATAGDERAAGALARVQRLVGLEGVVTAVAVGGRSPAEQVQFVPWGDEREPEPTRLPRAATRDGPVWPGAVPAPSPAIVYSSPLPAEVVDADGNTVVVTGRLACRAAPAKLSIAGDRWIDVSHWAGPWPVDERWWDPPAHRRRARFQVVTTAGTAHLLAVEGGRWWIEATYD